MSSPNRGRSRGYGRGRGYGSSNMLPRPQETVPLIGDWTVYHHRSRNMQQLPAHRNMQQLPAPPKKEDIPSSSNSASASYKDAAVNDAPPDKEYLENPITEHIMFLEEEDLKLSPSDGWSLRTRYLESRGYAGLYNQARMNLEILLKITESVTITHHFQNNNPENFMNFSKCHINKILLPREWGLNPNSEKDVKIAEGKYVYFNYWDYIQAFTKSFYYQNPKNKHSWFFSINPEVLDKPVPNWFYQWWAKFGPSLEILPKELKDLYNPWYDTSPLVSNAISERVIFGQCPFIFFAKFQIPWIWRWSVTISQDKRLGIPNLQRNFFSKFWSNMDPEDLKILGLNIKATTKSDGNSSASSKTSQQPSVAGLKNYFQKKYPSEPEDQIKARILEAMKEQFLSSFPEEDESMKTISSQGSMDDNSFNYLAGESQEVEDLSTVKEPSLGDFWDSMIQASIEKSKK